MKDTEVKENNYSGNSKCFYFIFSKQKGDISGVEINPKKRLFFHKKSAKTEFIYCLR